MQEKVCGTVGQRPPHCVLRCLECGRQYTDHRLSCDSCPNALLRTEYQQKRFQPTEDEGIFRYRCWLPASNWHATQVGPCVFASSHFGPRIGLRRLLVAFNGYWPEKGAFNITGTFKDHEASPTLAYFREKGCGDMILSSVGNTARAFAHACSVVAFPCCVVIPEQMLHRLWLPCPQSPWVRVLVIRDSCDYNLAIRLGEKIRARFNVMVEGGARNVARRDGMGTSVLEFARVTGQLPDHYVQAIGSGTGAIAAYEASLRLRDDGRFGERLPRLHLVQNAPFTPIHEAWQQRRLQVTEEPSEQALAKVRAMYADVLANAKPPYALQGGVRTALQETNGITHAVTREEAQQAKALFETTEGITINEPAACACAGIIKAAREGTIQANDSVLLNITGGGYDRLAADYRLHKLTPSRFIDQGDVNFSRLDSVEDLFEPMRCSGRQAA